MMCVLCHKLQTSYEKPFERNLVVYVAMIGSAVVETDPALSMKLKGSPGILPIRIIFTDSERRFSAGEDV